MYEFQKTKKRVIYWYQWEEWPGFYCTLKGWFKSSGWDRWKSLGLHCNSLSSSCSWYEASSVSMEKGEKAKQYVLFDSCKIQKLFIKLQSKGCDDCRIPFCLCTLNIMWKNCPLPHTVLENVLRLKPFMTSLFGKVAAWLWKLWCVPTTGSPLCPSFEGQSCAHYDAVLCHPKKPICLTSDSLSELSNSLPQRKKGKKKKLQCGSPTEFVIYSIFIFSLNVKQDLWKLGVVQGFGKIEINGLHPTFHNIIKSEMFWIENLLLDYKVSLIVLPPSSLTLLQTTASKSSLTFMS